MTRRADLAAWLPGAFLILVLPLVFALYRPGLGGPLILDDIPNVLEPLRALDHRQATVGDVIAGNESGPLGRPVAMLSFVADWLASGTDVVRLKYTNLMVHLLCGTLVFWLTGRLLGAPGVSGPGRTWWMALWVAVAWLCAPLLASTVLYVIQRMAQLAALFLLAGLLCYVMGRQHLAGEQPRLGMALILAGFAVFWPLAALSKENGLLFPLLALVVETFVFRFRGTVATRRFLLVLFALTVLVPGVVALVTMVARPQWFFGGYVDRGFGPGERLLTESRALMAYMFQLLVPRGNRMGVYQDDYLVSTGLLSPASTSVSLIAWGALLVLAYRLRGGPYRLVFFGLAFYLAGHALESSVFSLEPYFEHRNYLPSIGIYIAMVLAVDRVMDHMPQLKRALVLFMVVLPATYAVATYNRAQSWKDLPTFMLTAAETHPNSPRMHSELAAFLAKRGDLEGANAHLTRVAEISPRDAAGVALQRFWLYCEIGVSPGPELYQALEQDLAWERRVYVATSFRRLTTDILAGRCPGLDLLRFTQEVQAWLSREPGEADQVARWVVEVYLGKLLASRGDYQGGIRHLRAAWDAQPSRLEAGMLLARYQIRAGDIVGARATVAEMRANDHGQNDVLTAAIPQLEAYLDREQSQAVTQAARGQ
jgi:tetratricopeptide (TPR) repeat protein